MEDGPCTMSRRLPFSVCIRSLVVRSRAPAAAPSTLMTTTKTTTDENLQGSVYFGNIGGTSGNFRKFLSSDFSEAGTWGAERGWETGPCAHIRAETATPGSARRSLRLPTRAAHAGGAGSASAELAPARARSIPRSPPLSPHSNSSNSALFDFLFDSHGPRSFRKFRKFHPKFLFEISPAGP